MSWWRNRFVRRLLLVTLAGLAIRVGYVVVFRNDVLPLAGDSFFYSRGAELLVDGHGFIEPLVFEGLGVEEESASHPPLYLVWLAAASLLDPGGTSQLTHMLWSCLLGAATVFVCGLAGREVGGPRVGLIAAGLAAVYPNAWLHDGMLLSETAALFCTAMVVLLAYRFWHRPSTGRAAWIGLWCGLAALSRPELLLCLPLVMAPLALRARGTALGRRLAWIGVAGAVTVATLLPWMAFNLSRFDEPVYLTHGFGYQLVATNCDATYYGDDLGFLNRRCADEGARAAVRPGMDPSEKEEAVRRRTLRYVGDHLERLPVVVAARWGRITGLYRPREQLAYDEYNFRLERWVAESSFVSYYLMTALAIGGAVVLWRRGVPLLPLVALQVITLLAVALVFAQTRYRATAGIALVILAAVFVDAVVGSRRREDPIP